MPAPYRTMSDSALEAVVGGMAEDALEASALRDDVARLQVGPPHMPSWLLFLVSVFCGARPPPPVHTPYFPPTP